MVLSFHHVDPRIKVRSSGQAILWPPIFLIEKFYNNIQVGKKNLHGTQAQRVPSDRSVFISFHLVAGYSRADEVEG